MLFFRRHAKVIAMTCTHAALVRQQMVDIRLRYDSLIMEEAAQALEVETFVPMVLQKTESGGTIHVYDLTFEIMYVICY